MLIINNYLICVRKYGLRNLTRKIWQGGLFFCAIHAFVLWYAKYQIGEWGERMEAVSRAFDNHNSLWHGVSTVLGFPFALFDVSGMAYFALMVLNSVLWGVVISFIIVPAFVKRG